MFILATEVQQNIEQNVEELDKKVSRFSTVIDDGINKAIDFGFDLFLAIVIFIIGRIVLSLVRKLFKKIMNKSNIDEELVRLSSHLVAFKELLETDGPIGRKLDFIVQELNREFNTIGSKANDKLISSLVIDGKAELEKIREQIQNIE